MSEQGAVYFVDKRGCPMNTCKKCLGVGCMDVMGVKLSKALDMDLKNYLECKLDIKSDE